MTNLPAPPPAANLPPAGAPPPSPVAVAGRLRFLTVIVGMLFLAGMAGLGVVLFWVTGGDFLPAHWTAFFVLVALVTGLGFWLFTGSTGDFRWKEFGVTLGGGAAIGASFMMLAHWITPARPPNLNVLEVLLPDDSTPSSPRFDSGIARVTAIPNESRYIVEFRENAMTGNVHFRYLARDGKRMKRTYVVPRVGTPEQPVDQEEN